MKPKYHSLYRLAASFAVLCAAYPPAAMTCRLLGYGAGAGVAAALVCVAIGLLGYGFRRLLERGLLSKAARGALIALAALLPAGAVCWAQWGRPWYQILIAGSAALLMFCAGAVLAGRAYHEILTESVFNTLSVFYVAVSLAAWIVYAETPIWITVLFYLALVTAYGLVRNQSNIEHLTVSRHFTLDYLPEKIRSYNFTLLILILAVILVLFVVAGFAAGPFDRAMNVLRDYVNTSMHGQAGGTDLIDPMLPGKEGPGPDEVVPDAPSAFALLLAQSVQIIIYAGIIGIFVALFLFNRDAILAFFYRIYQWIAAMGRGLRAKPASARQLEEDVPDYVDVVQTVAATEEELRSEEDEYREWRRAYRRYVRMADSDAKYRAGYSLARKGLALSGLEVRPSDTTLEVAGKSELVLEDDRYGRATTLYNAIYYGPEEYTPGNLRALDDTLQELRGLGKRRVKHRGKKRETAQAAAAEQTLSPAALARRQAMGDLYREPPKERKITPLMIVLIAIAAVLVVLFAVSFFMSYKQSHPWLFH